MVTMTEQIELLGKNIYTDIPSNLTLKAIPTSSELEYVSAENFDEVMLNKIFPIAIEEKIDFRKLLEVDFRWICRCLRMLNYGYYMTTNAIFCDKCPNPITGKYQVDFRSVACKPIPDDFTGEYIISRDDFIDFDKDIRLRLLTIGDNIKLQKDEYFKLPNGMIDLRLATICYSIVAINNEPILPIESKVRVLNELSPADYTILKDAISEKSDFGLRAGGSTVCPVCGSREAAFYAPVNDSFFRPSVADLRAWKLDRNKQREENNS